MREYPEPLHASEAARCAEVGRHTCVEVRNTCGCSGHTLEADSQKSLAGRYGGDDARTRVTVDGEGECLGRRVRVRDDTRACVIVCNASECTLRDCVRVVGAGNVFEPDAVDLPAC